MDAESVDESTISIINNDPGGAFEAASTDEGTPEEVSSEKEVIRDVGIEAMSTDKGSPEDVSSDIEMIREVAIEALSNDNGTLENVSSENVVAQEVSIEAISTEKGTLDGVTSEKEVIREVGNALIRLGLDIACCSEKLVNLNLFMMHVAARESDFEVFASKKSDSLVDFDRKALEFDILSGIFDLEVREMDSMIGGIETEFNNTRKLISSYQHLGEAVLSLKEQLSDAEESIRQSHEQVAELMMQSTKFQKILSSVNQEETSDEDKEAMFCIDFFNTTTKLKLQTSEQQRHVLRMMEKSLARELELENELKECMQSLDEMKRKLNLSQLKVLSAEEETAAAYALFLEADSVSAVLMGISKELICKLQLCQFQINSALHRESEMNARLQECTQAVQNLAKKEAAMQEITEKNSLEALTLKEKVSSLEEQLNASESALRNGHTSLDCKSEQHKIKELEEIIFIAESRAQNAEAESKLLAETNENLNEELTLLKNNGVSIDKVDSLEKQLKETDIQLQGAIASVEASQEKQTLLYSSISDMEILIEKLKSKVLEADERADSAEDKCIILSESHAELNEELTFLRGKLECLETSLQHAEEAKQATAKDINMRSKVITDMVMQLAVERERLQKQISMLMTENRDLVAKLHMANKVSSNFMNREGRELEKGVLSSGHDASSVDNAEGKKEDSDSTEVEKSADDVLDNECNSETEDLDSKLETVRTIDAGRLNVKYVFSASLIVLIAILAVCFIRPENCPF